MHVALQAASDRELHAKIALEAKNQLVALLDGIILALASNSRLSINESARLALGALNGQRARQGDLRFRVTATSKTLSDAVLSEEDARRGLGCLAEKKLIDESEKGVFALNRAGVEAWEYPERLDGLLPIAAEPGPEQRDPPAPQPASEGDPLARLKTARALLAAHREGKCPKCSEHTLSYEDHFEQDRDAVVRTWKCSKCDYRREFHGIPISEWKTSTQDAWYGKAAAQRAKDALIRCPTCGNESIKAKETGVRSVGTSTHVSLRCEIEGCEFREREIERSIIGTGRSHARNAVLLAVVLGGAALVAGVLHAVGKSAPVEPPPTSTGSTGSSIAPTPAASPGPSGSATSGCKLSDLLECQSSLYTVTQGNRAIQITSSRLTWGSSTQEAWVCLSPYPKQSDGRQCRPLGAPPWAWCQWIDSAPKRLTVVRGHGNPGQEELAVPDCTDACFAHFRGSGGFEATLDVQPIQQPCPEGSASPPGNGSTNSGTSGAGTTQKLAACTRASGETRAALVDAGNSGKADELCRSHAPLPITKNAKGPWSDGTYTIALGQDLHGVQVWCNCKP